MGDVDCCKLVARALWAVLLAGAWDSDSLSEKVEAKALEVFEQDQELHMTEVGWWKAEAEGNSGSLGSTLVLP